MSKLCTLEEVTRQAESDLYRNRLLGIRRANKEAGVLQFAHSFNQQSHESTTKSGRTESYS